jgi:hypothetical protein
MNPLHLALTLAAVLPALGMLTLIWRSRDGSPAQRAYDRHTATRPIRTFDPRIQGLIAADRGPNAAEPSPLDGEPAAVLAHSSRTAATR